MGLAGLAECRSVPFVLVSTRMEILAGRVRLRQQQGGDVSLVKFVNGGDATGFDEHASGWMVLKRLSERERAIA